MVATPKRKYSRLKMGKSGQLTIPAHIRRKLGVALGDYVEFVEDASGRITVRPVDIANPSELADTLGPRSAGVNVDNLNRESVHDDLERRQDQQFTD